MPKEEQAIIVSAGGASARLHLCADGLWRWHYYEDGKRRTASAKSLHAARKRAKERLQDTVTARKHHRSLSASEASLFSAWLASRKGAPLLSSVASDYLAQKNAAGYSEHHLRTLRQDLENISKAFPHAITVVTALELQSYIDAMTCGPRRKNNVRQVLCSLFRWARDRQILPDQRTAADMTAPAKIERKPIQVFSPDEVVSILSAAGKEWRPALAIQAFAGIRTEELSRLNWGNVMLKKRLIEVPAAAAKTGRRRLVPIFENLATFLAGQHSGKDSITPPELMDTLIKRLVRSGIDWKKNGLRHSYGSYRCAQIADPARVAFEMGNSAQMVMRNYHEAQELETAIQWFSVTNTEPVIFDSLPETETVRAA